MTVVVMRIGYADGRVEERALAVGTYRVGREVGEIVMNDPNLSANHAALEVRDDSVSITDLGSTNGTYDFAGNRLAAPYFLQPERPVRMGNSSITLVRLAAAAGGTQVMPQMPPPAGGPGFAVAPTPPPPWALVPVGTPPRGHSPGPLVPVAGAPFGVDPMTNLPYSDKSKVAAGLLQIFLGQFGVGRFYTGHTALAVAQLVACFVGVWICSWFTCGLSALVVLWPLVDGIVILAGRSTDAQGRLLRS